MPDAQIPVMILTPYKSCLLLDKAKIKQHPNWSPYAFDILEFHVSYESDSKNEYAKYRKGLIEKEKKFVQEHLAKQQS